MDEDSGREQMLQEGLSLLKSALDLLDRAAAPAHIGAHVDLALHQLASLLSGAPQSCQLSQTPPAAARN